MAQRVFNIAMVTEFFFPRCGGVEIHVLSICKELIKKGHNVIVITRYERDYLGVKEVSKGLRVYYLPLENMTMGTIFPSFFIWLPTLRYIVLKEKIEIVHYHQCTSVMLHTSIREIELLGIHTVYTDHSIMSTKTVSGITMNKVFRTYSSNINAFICVSNANATNFIMRQEIQSFPPSLHIIPNGVDQEVFLQNTLLHPLRQQITNGCDCSDHLTIGVLSRLVVRKGVLLLVEIIDCILEEYPTVCFIIGGGGEESYRLHQCMSKWNQDHIRVLYMGELPHTDVPAFLSCIDVFLSCSLTESFNITLLEAFISGCILVSTNVGGVPELLPSSRIILKEPNVNDLVSGLRSAISCVENNHVQHPRVLSEEDKQILENYNWTHVTERVIEVYNSVIKERKLTLVEFVKSSWNQGFGTFLLLMVELMILMVMNGVLSLYECVF